MWSLTGALLLSSNHGTAQSKQSHILRYHDIPLETLYNIPQATWDEFLNHLPNKEVLEILNTSYYRHIWKSYNFCVTPHNRKEDVSNELMRKRASLISNHHFLLPLLHHTGSKLVPSLLNSTLWNDAQQTRLCTTEQSRYVAELAQQIYLANLNLDDLRKICPYYTKSLFKKLSHCDANLAWDIWIRLIDDYAKVQTVDKHGAIH